MEDIDVLDPSNYPTSRWFGMAAAAWRAAEAAEPGSSNEEGLITRATRLRVGGRTYMVEAGTPLKNITVCDCAGWSLRVLALPDGDQPDSATETARTMVLQVWRQSPKGASSYVTSVTESPTPE